MATTRIRLDRLPSAALTAAEEHTGPSSQSRRRPRASTVRSRPASPPQRAPGTSRACAPNTPASGPSAGRPLSPPFLTGLAPALRWRVETSGWDLLGFEALTGHHADYAPGSPDLPEVAALLSRLGETPCPGIELRHAEQRLEHYAAHPDDLRFFAGPQLLQPT